MPSFMHIAKTVTEALELLMPLITEMSSEADATDASPAMRNKLRIAGESLMHTGKIVLENLEAEERLRSQVALAIRSTARYILGTTVPDLADPSILQNLALSTTAAALSKSKAVAPRCPPIQIRPVPKSCFLRDPRAQAKEQIASVLPRPRSRSRSRSLNAIRAHLAQSAPTASKAKTAATLSKSMPKSKALLQ